MRRVLVVDDSATQLTLLKALLSDRGYEVETACNGQQALEKLSECAVDLVVTDMQMPEKNGVELIREMAIRHPLVPAVLVTAFGNEDLAAEALGVGATNYISKDHLGVLLPETVQRILAFNAANAESLLLKGALTRSRFEFLIDCSFDRIVPLVCLQLRMLGAMNVLHTGDRIRIAEALNHLLFHSILHGNLEHPLRAQPYSMEEAETVLRKAEATDDRSTVERCVAIQMKVNDSGVRFRVSHDGNGPSINQAPLPGTPRSFSDERGRAMMLLTSVMNEVFIDPVSGEVTLVKHFSRS